ncbi:MAG: TonB-dependent receptor [Muribaculaceae bacterium]|nr:TonB-dependent receptor [Muribaculaceae bacterium]
MTNTNLFSNLIIRAITAALLCTSAFPLLATTVTDEVADTLMQLPAVSVTAIKGGGSVEKTESATWLTRTEIERLNLVNIKQASEIAPNFYMPQYGSRMTSSVYVRGLGTRIDQPVVGLNIDNVPILNKDNFDFDIADIERIEILRGPQNILYGRNTMGGLINIHTLSPFSFEGLRLSGEYATHNSYRASAGIYKRVRPSLGMALNLYATGTDGFWRNSFNNSKTGVERQWSGRWKTSWRPASEWIAENTASVSHSVQHGYPYQSVESGLISYNDTCFYKRLTVTDGLTARGRIGNIDLSAIGSFQYINDNMTLDQDFLPLDYFTLTQKRHEWSFTLDMVAKGCVGKSYNWLAGAFGFIKRADMSAPVRFFDYGISSLIEDNANAMSPDYPIIWDERELLLGSDFIMPAKGISLYHRSSLNLAPFTFEIGLRWDLEHTAIDYHSHTSSSYTVWNYTVNPPVPHSHNPVIINDRGSLSNTYSQFLPRVSVSYALPSSVGNIYASVTKGYKSGGFNTQMFSDVLQQRIRGFMGLAELYSVDEMISYKPEKTWNYELGTHLSFLDHRLTVDAAMFWIECRNQQLTMFPEGSITGRIMANAGRSRSRGVEIAASWQLPKGFALRTCYGFTDARFTDFSNGRINFAGRRVPYAPANTLFLGAAYSTSFRNSFIDRLSADVNLRGVGRIYWD